MKPCDIEVSCNSCGEKNAKFRNVGKAWHTLEIEISDEKKLIIDGVDMKPAPFQREPRQITFFKNGKEQTVEDLRSVTIAVTTLCTRHDCDDPMCQIWQELQRLKARGFWKKVGRFFGRKKA